jgi:hypothetical protein
MKPTTAAFSDAIELMSRTIPFFPQDQVAMKFIFQELESMVSTQEQLEWLARAACRHMKQFNLSDLRGMFCSRYEPADGDYGVSDIPGYTLEESISRAEREYQQRESQEFDRKLIEWKEEAKLLGAAPDPGDLGRLLPGADKSFAMPPLPKRLDKLREYLDARSGLPSLKEAEADMEQAPRKPQRSEEESATLLAELEAKLKKSS